MGEEAGYLFTAGAGFPGDGVAGNEGLDGLGAGEEEGEVGGGDDQDVAEGIAVEFGLDTGEPEGAVFCAEFARGEEFLGVLFEEADGVEEGEDLGDEGVGLGAVEVRGDGLGEVFGVGGDPVTGFLEKLEAFGERAGGPAALGVGMEGVVGGAEEGASGRVAGWSVSGFLGTGREPPHPFRRKGWGTRVEYVLGPLWGFNPGLRGETWGTRRPYPFWRKGWSTWV